MSAISVKCFVCDEQPRYQCPRCGVHYCCLACYKDKKHEVCSEGFYKEQVLSTLKDMKGSQDDKKKMLQLLQQNQQQMSRDHDIEQRLAGIHLDDHEALWENLTEHEKYIFEERLRTGNVDFLKLWKPWWERDSSSKKVKLPSLFKNMESCETLLKGKTPNCSVKYNIVEVLVTYTYLMRLFNGDMYDSPNEVVETVYKLSNVLSEDQNFGDIKTVFYLFVQNHGERLHLDEDALEKCILDLKYFTNHKTDNLTRAVCDFHDRIKKLRRILKGSETETRLYKTTKKLYFLAIYTNEHKNDLIECCNSVLRMYGEMRRDKEKFNEQLNDIERHKETLQPKKQQLIEEIP